MGDEDQNQTDTQAVTETSMQAAGGLVNAYVLYTPEGLSVYSDDQYEEKVVPAMNAGYNVLTVTFAKRTFEQVA